MIFSYLNEPLLLLFVIPSVLVALTVHEWAHGYIAYKMGDTTAKDMGRLTLNPIKHINPVGALCMLLVGVGWANPVPVNPRNFKNPKKGMALVSLAGPLSNIILSVFALLIYLIALALVAPCLGVSAFLGEFMYYLGMLFYVFHIMSLSLGIFNLLPFPPLDGYRVIFTLLPPKITYWLYRHEKQLYIALLVWMLIGPTVVNLLLGIPGVSSHFILRKLAKCFSIGEIVSYFVRHISRFFIWLFSFIPFL